MDLKSYIFNSHTDVAVVVVTTAVAEGAVGETTMTIQETDTIIEEMMHCVA